MARQCYPFLDDLKLCANVGKKGKQSLEICDRDASKPINSKCKCPSRISCIHTVMNVPTKIRGKRRGRRIGAKNKFKSFKSWTQGIAEAGIDSFVIQAQIDEANRAYPLAKPLLVFAAKRHPELMKHLLKQVEKDCMFEGQLHKPCLTANLENIKDAIIASKDETSIAKMNNLLKKI